MSKMGLHDPFEYLQHKLWLKQSQKSKCQLDSQPLKVKNRFDLRAYKGACHISLERSNKGYNFALNLTLIRGLHKKFSVSKVMRVAISGISRFPT